MEMSDDHGPVAAKLAHVQHVIRSGGFGQQLMAVTLLRLTPIVPFSASNYVLGLTPVGGVRLGFLHGLMEAHPSVVLRCLTLDGPFSASNYVLDLAPVVNVPFGHSHGSMRHRRVYSGLPWRALDRI